MRMTVVSCGVLATVALAAPASAAESVELQEAMADPWVVTREAPATVSDLLTRIDRDARFTAGDRPAYGPEQGWSGYAPPTRDNASPWVASNRDVWFENNAFDDRLRLRTEGPVRRADARRRAGLVHRTLTKEYSLGAAWVRSVPAGRCCAGGRKPERSRNHI